MFRMKIKHSPILIAFLLSVTVLISCEGYVPDTTPVADPITGKLPEYAWSEAAPSLYEAYADYFDIGTAVNVRDISDPDTVNYLILDRQFNTFVYENECKPDYIHPEETVYDFNAMDHLVEWASSHQKKARGHTLIWYKQNPDWLFKDGDKDAAPELLLQRMESHVRTIVSRYKGQISTWDVVNEALDDSSGLRNSDWLRLIGDLDGDGDEYDYIEAAFKAAHESDPDARLIINDYDLESSTRKAQQMYELVKALLQQGIPVHGIGLQMHIDYQFDIRLFQKNVALLAKLREIDPDFKIEITELDISCYPRDSKEVQKALSDSFIKRFDAKYAQLFRTFMNLSEQGILDTVVFWGYFDGASWLNESPVENRTDYPLLIDRSMKFKSAYWAVYHLPFKDDEAN